MIPVVVDNPLQQVSVHSGCLLSIQLYHLQQFLCSRVSSHLSVAFVTFRQANNICFIGGVL
jgi:hypothetical protein